MFCVVWCVVILCGSIHYIKIRTTTLMAKKNSFIQMNCLFECQNFFDCLSFTALFQICFKSFEMLINFDLSLKIDTYRHTQIFQVLLCKTVCSWNWVWLQQLLECGEEGFELELHERLSAHSKPALCQIQPEKNSNQKAFVHFTPISAKIK